MIAKEIVDVNSAIFEKKKFVIAGQAGFGNGMPIFKPEVEVISHNIKSLSGFTYMLKERSNAALFGRLLIARTEVHIR